MTAPDQDALPIRTAWIQFPKWLLPAREMPSKRVRFTFASRINRLVLDIAEDLAEALDKQAIPCRINLRLEKLQVLVAEKGRWRTEISITANAREYPAN